MKVKKTWHAGIGRWVLVTVLAMGIALGGAGATAMAAPNGDEENPHLWKPKVKSVSVFKNGLGFFMREGKVTLDKGWAVSKHVPPAAFGTLAIYSHDEKSTVDIVGSGPGQIVEFDGVDSPDTIDARRERLGANMELTLELSYERDERTLTVAGKLRSVGPKYAILQAKASNFAVPIAAIKRLRVLDLPIRVHLQNAEAGKQNTSPASATIGMAYLRKGITWIPEYSLKIIDAETAELTLRGTLVNEAEDIIHCDVNFVVGVPHFVHTDFMAPIAVGQMIRTIGTAVAPPQLRGQLMNGAMIARSNATVSAQFKVVTPPKSGSGKLSAATGNLPSLAGPGGTDYTVYTKSDLTVRRGEKAIVTLFTRTIRYSHVYRWDPPGKLRHLLVLENSTPTAWTTGPCLAISEGRPLSEDLLKYVPQGGSGEIPVTTAINVANDISETEIDRKLKAHSPKDKVHYDLVKLRGTIKVRNFEKRAIKVVVTQSVPGKPIEASAKGKIRIDTQNLRLLERRGRIEWLLEIKPGQTREVTYVYERYVAS